MSARTQVSEAGPRIADLINAALGAILFLSPWIFGFVPENAANWNAWVSGIVVAGLALAALTTFAEWEEWLNLIAGVWVAVSPWLVGFSGHPTATQLHVIIGLIVAVAAALRLWMHRSPPRVTT